MSLDRIVVEKFKKNKLHNLYVLEPSTVDHDNKLIKWTQEILTTMLSHSGQTQSVQNHEDILFLQILEDHKQYLVDQIESVIKFLNYSPTSLKRKFVVIEQSECLTEIAINKLLKTFEEPEVPTTFFCLNAHKAQLLETLVSRAIKLRINISQSHCIDDINLNEIKDKSFHHFSEYIAKNNITNEQLIAAIFKSIEKRDLTPQQSDNLINKLQQLKTMQQFNSSQNSKNYLIHRAITQLF